MPTIKYEPLDLVGMIPGRRLQAPGVDIFDTLGRNDRWLHATHAPSLFSALLTNEFPADSAAEIGAFTTVTGSNETLAVFNVQGNAAKHPIIVDMVALVSAGSTTGTIRVTYGGAASSVTTTSTTATSLSVTVTPSSTSAPDQLEIQGSTDTSAAVVVVAVAARFAPADRSDGGADAAGYIPFGDDFDSSYSTTTPIAANKGIPTEILGRGWNNCRAIGRDRVVCLATVAHPLHTLNRSGRPWTHKGSAPALLCRLYVPPCDVVTRPGRVSVYFVAPAAATATIGVSGGYSYPVTISSTGWHHQVIELQPQGTIVTISGVSASGVLGLATAQVFREPIS